MNTTDKLKAFARRVLYSDFGDRTAYKGALAALCVAAFAASASAAFAAGLLASGDRDGAMPAFAVAALFAYLACMAYQRGLADELIAALIVLASDGKGGE